MGWKYLAEASFAGANQIITTVSSLHNKEYLQTLAYVIVLKSVNNYIKMKINLYVLAHHIKWIRHVIRAHPDMCIRVRMHMRTHVYVQMFVYIGVHACMHALHAFARIHAHMCVCVYVGTRVCVCEFTTYTKVNKF